MTVDLTESDIRFLLSFLEVTPFTAKPSEAEKMLSIIRGVQRKLQAGLEASEPERSGVNGQG